MKLRSKFALLTTILQFPEQVIINLLYPSLLRHINEYREQHNPTEKRES